MEQIMQVTLTEMPSSFDSFFQQVPGLLNRPEQTAAWFLLGLQYYAQENPLALPLLCLLRNQGELDIREIQNQLEPMRRSRPYLPLSYWKGACPQNGYQPEQPYTLLIKEDPRWERSRKKRTLYLGCGGSGFYRPITLHKVSYKELQKAWKRKDLEEDLWFVEEYPSLLLEIPKPTGGSGS